MIYFESFCNACFALIGICITIKLNQQTQKLQQ